MFFAPLFRKAFARVPSIADPQLCLPRIRTAAITMERLSVSAKLVSNLVARTSVELRSSTSPAVVAGSL
jgi:hypothetical protein